MRWEFVVDTEDGADLGAVVGFRPAYTGSHWQIRDASQPRIELTPEERAEFEELESVFRAVEMSNLGVPDVEWAPVRPPGWTAEWPTHAALCAAETFDDLRALQATTLASTSSSLDVYSIPSERRSQLVELLRLDEPPSMRDLLGPDGIFVSLNLAIDLGFSDVLVVEATREIGDAVDSLAAELDVRIGEYEAGLPIVHDMPSLLAALGRLAGVTSPDE